MDSFRSGQEHRKYPRVSYKEGVQCKGREAEVFQGELAQDLSSGGIRIRSNMFFPVGEQISIGIRLMDNGRVGRMVEAVGKVVWVRFNPYSDYYQIGVEFENNSNFTRSRINGFIGSL